MVRVGLKNGCMMHDQMLTVSRQGKARGPSPWLSSVYTTTLKSRDHVLLLHIMLSRDAQTDFIEVEVMYMYLTGSD